MKKITTFTSLCLILSFNVQGQTTRYTPPSEYIASGQFEALLGSVPDTMEEYSRNQSLATLNTFLGRADLNSALEYLPSGNACTAGEATEQPGSIWMLDHAKETRVIMFNESHLTLASRTFVRSQLSALKELGYTHIGFEALPAYLDVSDPELAITSGYYTIETMFSALIRDAAERGMTIFGYESSSADLPQGNAKEQMNAREQFQAQNIIKVINSAPPDAKFIIFGGWSHIAEAPLPSSVPDEEMRWMASLFKEQSGIDPLTIDLTHCFYESDDTDNWKGKIFITDSGSPLIQGQYAEAVDGQIYLPAPSVQTPEITNYYRKSLGKPLQIPENLRSDDFPVLVQARLAGSNPGAIAHDRILLQPGEDFPMFLKKGVYTLTSYKGDGSIVGEQVVHIE